MQSLQRHQADTLFGQQNLHILNGLYDARRCTDWLLRNGFTVLSVQIDGHRPIVWIENGVRCGLLGGAMMSRSVGEHGVEQVMVALVEACQVHWRVVGN